MKEFDLAGLHEDHSLKAQVAPPMGAAEEGEEVAAPDTLERIRLKRSKMERCAQLFGAIRAQFGAILRRLFPPLSQVAEGAVL